jgi:exodeoxyribonuclease-3
MKLKNVRTDLIKDKLKQSRIISAEIEYKKKVIQLINIYTPNGNPVNTEKYDYKKNWMDQLINKKLFEIIESKPRKFLTKDQLTKDKYRAISDFISGMTDRYAINLYNNYK